jgi:quinol monooxygenase YgiN
MILFDVTLSTTDATRAALLALLRRTQAASQAEKGCHIYRFTQDIDDQNRIYLIELWDTEPDFFGHTKGEGFKTFMAQFPDLGTFVSSVPRQGDLAPYVFARPK